MVEKITGANWLHTHPELEKILKCPIDHVIVDRKDYEQALEVLKGLPQPLVKTAKW